MMATICKIAYFGKKLVPLGEASLSIASSAVLYGLSVYTVFPVSTTKRGVVAFRLEDHFERLLDSARIIGIDEFEKHWTFVRFKKAVSQVLVANKVRKDVFVRATAHVSADLPGTRSRGLATTLSIFVYDAMPIIPQKGARLKTSMWRRVPDNAIPARAKVNGAYVNSVLAKQDALDSGYDDCIFLDSTGHVCELSAANIFIVRDRVLITPNTASDILEGINRRTILEIAREMGIPTIERSIDVTELYVADEVFACGTSALVAPVVEVDKRVVGMGKIGAITAQLQERHHQLLRGEDPRHSSWLTPIV